MGPLVTGPDVVNLFMMGRFVCKSYNGDINADCVVRRTYTGPKAMGIFIVNREM
jgi:hypothetical protein